MSESERIDVQLVCAWPERAFVHDAQVSRGTTAQQLLVQSRVLRRFPQFADANPELSVFGRKVTLDYVLAPGDRVELLRALVNDPKESRRRRAVVTAATRPKR